MRPGVHLGGSREHQNCTGCAQLSQREFGVIKWLAGSECPGDGREDNHIRGVSVCSHFVALCVLCWEFASWVLLGIVKWSSRTTLSPSLHCKPSSALCSASWGPYRTPFNARKYVQETTSIMVFQDCFWRAKPCRLCESPELKKKTKTSPSCASDNSLLLPIPIPLLVAVHQ